MSTRADSRRVGYGRRPSARAPAACVLAVFVGTPCAAQIAPERLYYGVNQPVPVVVRCPDGAAAPEVRLYEPSGGQPIDTASAAPGRIDLASMFPLLWTTRKPRLLYAQLHLDGEAIGAPLVLQPMLTPRAVRDGLTDATLRAVENPSSPAMPRLLNMPGSEREALRKQAVADALEHPVYAGLRLWVDRHVILETSLGSMELRLRPDKAPNTVVHFLNLVEGGYYTNTPFHRIVAADAQGRPFLAQAGDPTGLGGGGPGFHIDLEPNNLEHDLGVVSLARRPDDPCSGGGQFFICLGKEACRALDGHYTAFAEVVAGGQALKAIASAPLGPQDPAVPGSPVERPLEPLVIITALLIEAPPFGTGPGRISAKDLLPKDR